MRFAILFLSAFSSFSQQSQPGERPQSQRQPDKQQEATTKGPPSSAPPSASHSGSVGQPATNERENNKAKEPDQIWKKAFSPETWANWTMVGITGIGVLLALRSLKAVEQQVRANQLSANAALVEAHAATHAAALAETTLLLTERADVLIESISLSKDGNLRPETVITLLFKNYGRTRANNVRVNLWLAIPDAIQKQEPRDVATVLGAGETVHLAFAPICGSLTKETFIRILRGEVPLRFNGDLTYMDVFGTSHTTKCSGTFDPRRQVFKVDENSAD